MNDKLGGGFKYFLFSPLLGEDSHFDSYFSTGLKPPTSKDLHHILVAVLLLCCQGKEIYPFQF